MPNLFLNIPVPATSGSGAPVDVSAMAKTKSFVIGGGFTGTVNVEYSTDDVGVGPWATIATFLQAGNLTIDFAAHWVRATSPAGAGGANLDVGSSDDGTVFALLPAAGTPVDISALPLFKTVVAPKGFAGNVELSEDGVSWAQIFSFQQGGGISRPYVAQFARVVGGADVWIAGAEDNGDALGGPLYADARVAADGATICSHASAVSHTGVGKYHVDFVPPFPDNVAVTATINEDNEAGAVIYVINVTSAGFDVCTRSDTDGWLLQDLAWSFVALESDTPVA